MNATLGRLLALLGLAGLGQGLFILFRIVPHESPWLGVLLAAAGALLLWRVPLPRIESLPRWPLLVGGIAASTTVVAWNVARGASWVAPKVAIVTFGLVIAMVAPLVRRPHVANIVAWSIPLIGAPLMVWGLQALSAATIAGMTPMEMFLRHALLAPMATALAWMGFHPWTYGQHIVFDTQQGGRMTLEVGVACSGLQAMALFGGILVAYILAEKPGWRRGVLWCAIGLFGVYVVNVVRLVSLAVVGSAYGSDALEWAHANLGWMFFVAWSGLFAWFAMGRPRERRGSEKARPSM